MSRLPLVAPSARVHRAVTYGCTVLSAGAADLARQPIGTRGEAARACDLWSGEAVAARPGPSAGQLVYSTGSDHNRLCLSPPTGRHTESSLR